MAGLVLVHDRFADVLKHAAVVVVAVGGADERGMAVGDHGVGNRMRFAAGGDRTGDRAKHRVGGRKRHTVAGWPPAMPAEPVLVAPVEPRCNVVSVSETRYVPAAYVPPLCVVTAPVRPVPCSVPPLYMVTADEAIPPSTSSAPA